MATISSIQECMKKKCCLGMMIVSKLPRLGYKTNTIEDSLAIEKYIFKGESFRSDSYQAIIGQSLAYNLSVL